MRISFTTGFRRFRLFATVLPIDTVPATGSDPRVTGAGTMWNCRNRARRQPRPRASRRRRLSKLPNAWSESTASVQRRHATLRRPIGGRRDAVLAPVLRYRSEAADLRAEVRPSGTKLYGAIREPDGRDGLLDSFLFEEGSGVPSVQTHAHIFKLVREASEILVNALNAPVESA